MGVSTRNELMTVAETCRYLGITSRTLYRYIQERHMPAFKLGKQWRFVRQDLDRWLRRQSAPHYRST